ncbi:MAG: hypothetical protein HY318_19540 [Armatimonadetes bacterium]|nr:hypothetical protein [Armatimonadota bacterium]
MGRIGNTTLIFLLAIAVGACSRDNRNQATVTTTPPRQQVYNADSTGWYWVYEGTGQAQYFLASAPMIESMTLRVAKLNDNTPEAPLEVEVRDEFLRDIYAHGTIAPTNASLEFQWIDVALNHVAKIEQSNTYILLLHSQQTSHRAPWIINAIYRDVYPHGRHLGNNDDLVFKFAFDTDHTLRVGPAVAKAELPISSGSEGGTSLSSPLKLAFSEPHPPVANQDPVGPVPKGRYVGKDR